jgi:hypothetical protein
MPSDPGTFTPTPEQVAIREARRLKRQRAATHADTDAASTTTPSSLVNSEKGQIVTRPWLAVQGHSPTNASRRVKIMTWNVCSFFIFHLTSAVCTALERHMTVLTTY